MGYEQENDQATALALWSRPSGRTLELVIQERVCVTDRPDREGDDCYMCKREAAEALASERTDRWN